MSPVLLPLAPVLVPAYFWVRWRKRRAVKTLGKVAGRLSDTRPASLDDVAEAAIDARPDTIALCRILGNDLVPRHAAGQTERNLRFLLENEPDLPGCRKLWLLNRIFDPDNEARLINLLESHGQTWERIPFEAEQLQRIGYDFATFDDPMVFADGRLQELDPAERLRMKVQAYRARNNYMIHNNGARNAALEFCLRHAKWALPFDGNCYFTASAWTEFRTDLEAQRDRRYLIVPMARMLDNDDLIRDRIPEPTEEPQIAFRCDAPLRFDPAHPYGCRPKVELLVHLGVPGPWQGWTLESFVAPPRKVSPEGHRVGHAGRVARMFSGQGALETSQSGVLRNRGLARAEAICATLDMLEARAVAPALATGKPLLYQTAAPDAVAPTLRSAIISAAEAALMRGPYSVMDKTETPPSGDKHDYFHPAPYWWPDPRKRDGLPYVQRDGERVPGTELYSPESERFDRTRLQRMFDDTTALALATVLTGRADLRVHAERLLETWFLRPETRMTPNLAYAQVRRGHNRDRGQPRGLIETKDFYVLLDAVRLLDTPDLARGLADWCAPFLRWLIESDQGKGERRAHNNHGTCYDLQTAALAAFLGDVPGLQEVNLRAQARLLATITPEGDQPHEMTRTLTQHYCAFNLQSWVNLFDLLDGAGLRAWNSAAGDRLIIGLRRMLALSAEGWQAPQIKPFDPARLVPLALALQGRTGAPVPQGGSEAPDCFFPHDGVAPFWRLSRSVRLGDDRLHAQQRNDLQVD